MINIGFIGAGTTGTALASRLEQQCYPVIAVYSRSLSSAKRFAGKVKNCQIAKTAQNVADTCQLVFITTPDDAIATVTSSIQWNKNNYVVHCSGAHSLDVLQAAKKSGALTGGFHPLQTFADIEQAINNLPGSTFAIEAAEPLLTILKEMAVSLKGDWVILKTEDKVLYHAAAVFASNYLVTLMKLATDLWADFGVPQAQATKALLPLLRGTLQNIQNVGLPNCLTGPIARGDLGTINKHIEALARDNPNILKVYKMMGTNTIPISLAKGKIDKKQAGELETILK